MNFPLSGAARACTVCATALPPGTPPAPYPVCHQPTCRMVVARHAEMGDVLFKPYLERSVKQLRQQTSHNQLLQQRKALETRQNQSGWAILQSALPAAAAPSGPADGQASQCATGIKQLVLPSGPHLQVKLTRLRRKRYRERLQATIAKALLPEQADQIETPPAPAQPALASSLPGHMCACCGVVAAPSVPTMLT